MASLWIILINTIDGVRRVNSLYLDLARTLETTTTKRTFKIIMPASLSSIVTGLRTALSTAWLVIVAADMIVGNRGMGTFVCNEWNAMNINSIIVAILVFGAVWFILDRSIAQLHRLIPHHWPTDTLCRHQTQVPAKTRPARPAYRPQRSLK